MAHVTTSETTLDKASAIWLSRHRDELVAHLPAPGRTWRWGETELSHAYLSQLKDRELIIRVNDEWRTTRQLWEALIQSIDAERQETVGVEIGQEQIGDPGISNSSSEHPLSEQESQETVQQTHLGQFDVAASDSEFEGLNDASSSLTENTPLVEGGEEL